MASFVFSQEPGSAVGHVSLSSSGRNVWRDQTACMHSPQRYDAGVDSHKIRLVSNIFTSIPCDWGQVAPGIKKKKNLKMWFIKSRCGHTHIWQLLQLPGKPVRISYLPDCHLKITRSTGLSDDVSTLYKMSRDFNIFIDICKYQSQKWQLIPFHASEEFSSLFIDIVT